MQCLTSRRSLMKKLLVVLRWQMMKI
uniref:Uncharacterized protein n=1 Tax=Arundo donax TaxID=35708 RepID=A0A0A9F0L2_ARUDO